MSGDHNEYQKPHSYLDFECPRCGHCCTDDYERGFVDGMQRQMQSSVDRAINKQQWVGPAKPITPKEMTAYVEATWNKCQGEAWRRKEVLRMAQEAGLIRAGENYTEPARWGITEITDFYNRAVAAEREACAKVCEDIDTEYEGEDVLATWCATAIRARGDNGTQG
jgi:hypothetical protein